MVHEPQQPIYIQYTFEKNKQVGRKLNGQRGCTVQLTVNNYYC